MMNPSVPNVCCLLRSRILHVGYLAGNLCHIANTEHATLVALATVAAPTIEQHQQIHLKTSTAVVHTAMAELLVQVVQVANTVNLDLYDAVQRKLELNRKKYPVELCKGKAGKYTQYSNITGITKTNQSTLDETNNVFTALEEKKDDKEATPNFIHSIASLAEEIRSFATERQWSQYHTPRNIILALLGEVGELAELVQWMGDDEDPNIRESTKQLLENPKFLDKLGQELADVTIYLLRLATVCHLLDPLQEDVAVWKNRQQEPFL